MSTSRKVFVKGGMETVLLGIGLGAIMLFFLGNAQRMLEALPVTDTDGSTITYFQSAFFWVDLGVVVFCILLILEGVIVGLSNAAIGRYFLAVLGGITVLINAYALFGFSDKLPPQIINALAGLFAIVLAVMALRRVDLDAPFAKLA